MFLSRFELRRFRGVLPKLALIFATLVPVIYGAIYLAANWDPYGRMSNLPVAIVNQDKPVSYNGKSVHAGQDFTDNLVEAHNFGWHVTNEADAEDGLRSGRYYLTVVVPPNFSKDLVSGSTNNPRQAQITMRRNDANGFVIGSVTGQAQNKIEKAVDQTAVKSYFEAVFANLKKIRDGMVSASKGSAQLTSGLQSAKSGSAQLTTGAAQLDTGAQTLASGASQLDSQYTQLESGAAQLYSGMGQLSTGSSKLASGASQVAAGTQELADTAGPVLDQAAQLNSQVRTQSSQINTNVQNLSRQVTSDSQSVASQLNALQTALAQVGQIPQVASSQAYKNAQTRLANAQTRTSNVATLASSVSQQSAAMNQLVQNSPTSAKLADASSKLKQLNSGAQQVSSGATTLHQGIMTAQTGAGTLSAGVNKAGGAIGQLSTGASQLSTGATTLHTNMAKLDSGLGQLLTGSKKLSKGLADGVKQIPALTSDQASGAATVLSSPAKVNAIVENPATYYGRGIAPLFFSIAMWVFGISGFLVMRPITARLLSGRTNPLRLTLSAFAPFGTVAVIGAMLMLAVVSISLPFDPVHGVALVGLVLLTALVFALIAHTLRMTLGLPGSALLLVWLILQLSATGGTYPAAVLPPFFRWIHPLMPITYSIDAFRVAISGGLWSHYAADMAVLAGIGILALVLDVLAVGSRQRFRLADLHPPL